MSVYVDDGRYPFGRMVMSHMVADTSEELLKMADRIGLRRAWLQEPGEYREHFDISQQKRALAVQLGALEVSRRELGRLLLRKRSEGTAQSVPDRAKISGPSGSISSGGLGPAEIS